MKYAEGIYYTVTRDIKGTVLLVKKYREGGAIVTEGVTPDRSQEVCNHSPDGFQIGYSGSGPSQLALAIVLDFLDGDETAAQECYQQFRDDYIAKQGADSEGYVEFYINGWEINRWVEARLKEGAKA